MAAPAEATVKSHNGKWLMVRLPNVPTSGWLITNPSQNKEKSGDFDACLSLVIALESRAKPQPANQSFIL
jgi:hypothetical protein